MIVPLSLLCLPIFWLLYAFAHDAWLQFIESEGKKALGYRMKKHGLKEITWELNETQDAEA
jgi:hypothetical protein